MIADTFYRLEYQLVRIGDCSDVVSRPYFEDVTGHVETALTGLTAWSHYRVMVRAYNTIGSASTTTQVRAFHVILCAFV